MSPGASLSSSLAAVDFWPSRGRLRETMGFSVGAGAQPSGRALPSLLPEGLGKLGHYQLALQLPHPFTLPPEQLPRCAFARRTRGRGLGPLKCLRYHSLLLLIRMRLRARVEWPALATLIHPTIRRVAERRSWAFVRELKAVVGAQDFLVPVDCVLGLPMLGPACQGPNFPPATKDAECSVEDLWIGIDEHNASILSSVRPSGDENLDAASWEKSEQEFEAGSLLGPHLSLASIPHQRFRLLARKPIWESHGGAEEPSCRNIDDMLVGRQNESVSYHQSHRPATLSSWAADTRATEEASAVPLKGYPSDYRGAYRQAPACPHQVALCIVAMWSSILRQIVFGEPAAQLFGGSSAPLNFSRLPDDSAEDVAVLFAVAFQQCIDDLLGQEEWTSADWGYICWRLFAAMAGWDVPDKKSPLPGTRPRVLGAFMHYGNLARASHLCICPIRLQAILQQLQSIQSLQLLYPGEAMSIHGKLMHVSDQMFGQVGRAHTRAFRRRSYEHRTALNPQLRAALSWWLNHLASSPPREVPLRVGDLPLAVSWGDGEGSDAGLGVVIVFTGLGDSRPRVGHLKTPPQLRRYWAAQREAIAPTFQLAPGDDPRDIQQIEAVNPAVILYSFPQLQHCLWLHFVDNNGALSGLVKGSASVMADEIILGHTWSQIAQRKIWVYFDRVDSESNISDLPSRCPVAELGDPLHVGWVPHRLYFPPSLSILIASTPSEGRDMPGGSDVLL